MAHAYLNRLQAIAQYVAKSSTIGHEDRVTLLALCDTTNYYYYRKGQIAKRINRPDMNNGAVNVQVIRLD